MHVASILLVIVYIKQYVTENKWLSVKSYKTQSAEASRYLSVDVYHYMYRVESVVV